VNVSRGGATTQLPGQSSVVEFATSVHEIAHEILHRRGRRANTSKPLREIEAEAVEFAIWNAVVLVDFSPSAADMYMMSLSIDNTGLRSWSEVSPFRAQPIYLPHCSPKSKTQDVGTEAAAGYHGPKTCCSTSRTASE
jgi:hypothetical protein